MGIGPSKLDGPGGQRCEREGAYKFDVREVIFRGLGLKFPGLTADKVNMQERRTEVRMLCADMVEVNWKDRDGHQQSATGLLEDISPSGACLQLDTAVPLGISIQWQSASHEFNGTVRYCVYREIGYFVGVEFVPESKWSKRTYKPQHLLDLKKLLG